MHRQCTILILMALSLLTSCRGPEVIYPSYYTYLTDRRDAGRLWILNEGNMGSNKARLDCMERETGFYITNFYGHRNPNQLKELGDVGNALGLYGHQVWATINCSHKVEVMDLNGYRKGQVDIPNCRFMAFANGKAYVSAYVGSIGDPQLHGAVYEVDTASLQVKRTVTVGHQPDGLCARGERLYVCNSGGYLGIVDPTLYDSTISIIRIADMQVEKEIPVARNLYQIVDDAQGRLWVSARGDYRKQMPALYRLENDRVVASYPIAADRMSIAGNRLYLLDVADKKLRYIDLLTLELQEDTPVCSQLTGYENAYGLLATEKYIYLTDAKNYVSSGMLHCYDRVTGEELWHTTTGDIPGSMLLTP